MSTQTTERYDYVVVGGGSAGSVIAARLADDPDVSVLLLEAGGTNRRMFVKIPLAWRPASMSRGLGWGYEAEPGEFIDGRRIDEPRGRLLGGTSSLHGMMYSRGNPADYAQWSALGIEGWTYDDVLPAFRAVESNWRGAGEHHGADGPVHVRTNPRHPVIYPAMIAAGRELGYDEVDDFNGDRQEGFGMPDFMVQPNGRRESSATAYLDRGGRRPNLTVRTGALAQRVILAGSRAVGVEYLRRGRVERVDAGEIVLAGGTYNSPQLLQLSGIGDPSALQGVGVTPAHELPAVGRNLQDHPMVHAVFSGTHGLRLDKELRLDRLGIGWAQWMLGMQSYLSDSPMSVQAFVRTQASSTLPDTQFQVVHVPYITRPWLPGERAPGDQFMGAGLQLHPVGRGSVSLRSADPTAAPVIRQDLFRAEEDKQAARDILRFLIEFFSTNALEGIAGPPLRPAVDLDDTDAVDAYLRQTIDTGKHPVGTCAMGADAADSVVDAELRVHGIDGLRVADGSVIPRNVTGNTDAPIKMIAHRAADFIVAARNPQKEATHG